SWALVRRELRAAVRGKPAKKAPLGQQMFIPETWSLDRDADLTARRITAMAALAKVGKTRPMMIAIGEV
ncbi:DUF1173 domain-containing protein, partial [Clostridioides difficile]|nr:DUF1173 domain-containing protein [Clostridioides difficile]